MSFSADITLFAEKTNLSLEQVLRKAGLDLLRGVFVRSPVKSGRYRGNHRVGLNVPDIRTFKGAGASSGAETGSEPSRAEMTLAGVQFILRAKVGDTIIISNNLVYAPVLEGGSSSQAPLGIYEPTVEDFLANFSKTVASIRAGASLE